ncbi:MAG: fructosamine kinase family protein [Solirubrobacteraceae bacterium]
MRALREELAEALGGEVRSLRRLGGGEIGDAWRVELEAGRLAFVKTREGAGVEEFALEAAGLSWIAEPGALRVPEVLRCGERFLALEWIEAGAALSSAGEAELGRGLAAIHEAGAAAFGGPQALRIGALALPNASCAGWAEFYAERRLRPLIGLARLAADERAPISRVCDRIDDFAGPPERAARLHGDLWRGNVLAGRVDGRPWLIDPAAYGGHREVDLAMLALFGGLSNRVAGAYDERFPLADGWRERLELWQIFPLLVHAALFGGGYGTEAARAARRYVG